MLYPQDYPPIKPTHILKEHKGNYLLVGDISEISLLDPRLREWHNHSYAVEDSGDLFLVVSFQTCELRLLREIDPLRGQRRFCCSGPKEKIHVGETISDIFPIEQRATTRVK